MYRFPYRDSIRAFAIFWLAAAILLAFKRHHERDGRVEMTENVYDNPANLFVATFIGSPAMNLLDGILLREADGAFAQIDGMKIPVSAWVKGSSGTSIVVGVRPEHLSLDTGNASKVQFRFHVNMVEPTGAESHIYGRCGGTDMIVAVAGRSVLSAGDSVQLAAPQDSLHVFEKEGGSPSLGSIQRKLAAAKSRTRKAAPTTEAYGD